MKMKILDLNMLLFFPADSGGKAGIYYRIRDLAKENDVCAIIINSEDDIVRLDKEYNLSDRLKIFINSPVTKPVKKANKYEKILQTVKWFISGKPRMAAKISSKEVREKFTKITNSFKPDIIYLESPFVYELLDWNKIDRLHTKVVLVVHNQEVEFFKGANNWPFIIRNIEIERIKRYEARIMEFANAVKCVAPEDAHYGQSIVGEKCKYIPSHLAKATRRWLPKRINEKYIYYSGALSFNPNLNGLMWFLESIYSRYIAKYPDIKLKITGNVSDEIKDKMRKYRQIEFTGYLSDMELEDLIVNSFFTVIPVLTGGGVKMKMLEAMKYGVPAISTEHVKNGIVSSVSEKVPFLYTNEVEKFLEYMNMLTENEDLRIMIGTDELDYFERVYSSNDNLKKWIG